MRSIVPSYGRFTVRASDYLKQDSDVMLGGGTDETELLQAILDKAKEWGGLVLEVDGAILMRGMRLHSNTTIHCANQNCGFYLADDTNDAIVQNAHLDYDVIRDENIQLLGGTYNINCEHQQRSKEPLPPGDGKYGKEQSRFEGAHYLHGLRFIGVRGLTMRDMRTVDQRVWDAVFCNWEHIVIENFAVELPHNYFAQNQDGLHFWGPGRDLFIHNIRGGSGDDFIALAPDEHDRCSDITDVLIDGVYLEEADQGIRMLSRGPGKLDRVTIRNVYGTYRSCGFFINPWFGKWCDDSDGNYGAITVENVQLRQTYHKYQGYCRPFLFRIGGRIQSLTLKNIQAIEPNDARELVDISHIYSGDAGTDNFVDIANLTVDGLEVLNREGTTEPVDYIAVDCKVDHLTVRNVLINRDGNPAADTVVHVKPGANVGTLDLSHVQGYGIEAGIKVEGDVRVIRRHCVFINDEKEK